MMLKPSNYNYIVKDENGDFLICNLLKGYGSLRKIRACNADLVSLLKAGETFSYDSQNTGVQSLADEGFLIDEQEDELFKIKVLYEDKVYSNYLNLIIMTTGQCNFRCKYCYEDFQQGAMTGDVQRKVLKYIQKQMNYFPRISIEWFGGEPLVERNVIENILQGVRAMCATRKTVYRSAITTNGYLLTPAVFDKLYHMNVLSYQVTLDGSRQEHDRQRILEDGGGTFDRILENLLYIRDNKRYTKANVVLRVNLTKPILEKLPEFLTLYRQNFASDKRFSLAFKQAGDLGTKDISGFRDNLLEGQHVGTHDFLKQYGLLDSTDYDLDNALDVLTPMSNLCYASLRNGYVIGPDGAVYKCTVHFDKKVNQIGYLNERGDMVLDDYLHSRWYSKERAIEERCRLCKFLPVCYGGGCTYYTNFKTAEGCYSPDLKRHVEDYIQYIARFMKIKEITK